MRDEKFQNVVTQKDGQGYRQSCLLDAATNERAAKLTKRYRERPAEELYDLTKDPSELNNLADDPEYRRIKKSLGKVLDAWIAEQGDKGIEAEKLAKTRQGRRKEQSQDRKGKRTRRKAKPKSPRQK